MTPCPESWSRGGSPTSSFATRSKPAPDHTGIMAPRQEPWPPTTTPPGWCPTRRRRRPTNRSWPHGPATNGPATNGPLPPPTHAALLDAVSPPTGQAVLITNADHDRLTADLRAAESNLDTAQGAHQAVPARLPLGQVNPGQQVLDVQTKLISHAIRIAAFNTATALARAIRVHTGYARANHEAHALVRQA